MHGKRTFYVISMMLLLLFAGALLLTGCGDTGKPADDPAGENGEGNGAEVSDYGPIKIGSKEFTEQLILGQIAILALEYNGIPTKDQTGLGGTDIARAALETGEIDLYWEYTGTALMGPLGHDTAITDPVECYNTVKDEDLAQNRLVWLDYTPFDNTYTLMMRKADADALGIVSISDLGSAINEGMAAPVEAGWVFATDHEYSIRDDGYPGLCELYGFEFADVVVMDLGITYETLRDGNVSVAMGFATDGRIAAFDLVNLQDDRHFHPVYNCSPVIREEALMAYPNIADILNPIAAALDAETMSTMNMKVDIEDYLPAEVAEEWLKDNGFIE